MKRVAVITATRAEYGLLKPVIEKLRVYENNEVGDDPVLMELRVDLIVTGTHLSKEYGMTVGEIEKDGLRIDYRLPIPVSSGSPVDISADQAAALNAFTFQLSRVKYDALYILGDRYEMLMAAVAALNTGTPIFHLCGGDTTEGAIDEAIRHSITKMSYLHFTTNEDSRRRVIQLGESPDRVYNVGSMGIDNILNMKLMSVEDVLMDIGADRWSVCAAGTDIGAIKYALCTYHPVTLDNAGVSDAMDGFLETVRARTDTEFIVTKSNSDMGGAKINAILDAEEKRIPNMHVYPSLGVLRYLSVMQGAEYVLGNSSSGLYEAPYMHIPTINIGSRQRGRLTAESVINCGADRDSILEAIDKAESESFKELCENVIPPFGDGHAAENIARISMRYLRGDIDLKKSFYDLPCDIQATGD